MHTCTLTQPTHEITMLGVHDSHNNKTEKGCGGLSVNGKVGMTIALTTVDSFKPPAVTSDSSLGSDTGNPGQ